MKAFKKARFIFRLTGAFWKARRRIILVAFLGGIIIALVIPRLYLYLQTKRPLKIGLVGRYDLDNLPREVLNQIGEGLVREKKDGSFQPALAKSWEILKKGKQYRFHLANDLSWHDGTELSSEDISFNFSDVLLKKINPKTIEFELKEAFSPFLSALAQPILKKGLIGTGEYQLESLKRNGQFVESLTLKPVRKSQKKFVYKFYPGEDLTRLAFKLGKIDVARGLTNISEFEAWPNVKIEENIRHDRIILLIFNNKDPVLTEKSIRQALNYSLKKDWTPRALGPLNPNSWAYNPNLKTYAYDLQKAKELLKKGFGGQESVDLELSLTTFSSLFPVAEKIAKQWEELSIKTKIQVTDVVPSGFQVFLVTQDLPSDPDQYLLWHSIQPHNLSQLNNPQIDKLLEDGRQILDLEKRKEIYFDFQRFLVEESPVVFLHHPTEYILLRDNSNV
ncbi:ABC transporter substrate-binding protein [Patescibacteria group bacterium]